MTAFFPYSLIYRPWPFCLAEIPILKTFSAFPSNQEKENLIGYSFFFRSLTWKKHITYPCILFGDTFSHITKTSPRVTETYDIASEQKERKVNLGEHLVSCHPSPTFSVLQRHRLLFSSLAMTYSSVMENMSFHFLYQSVLPTISCASTNSQLCVIFFLMQVSVRSHS